MCPNPMTAYRTTCFATGTIGPRPYRDGSASSVARHYQPGRLQSFVAASVERREDVSSCAPIMASASRNARIDALARNRESQPHSMQDDRRNRAELVGAVAAVRGSNPSIVELKARCDPRVYPVADPAARLQRQAGRRYGRAESRRVAVRHSREHLTELGEAAEPRGH